MGNLKNSLILRERSSEINELDLSSSRPVTSSDFRQKIVSRSKTGLSSSRYNGSAIASPSLELTKCCFNVTSSVLFVLEKQAKCIEKQFWLVEFSIQFQGISFESHEITRTDKMIDVTSSVLFVLEKQAKCIEK